MFFKRNHLLWSLSLGILMLCNFSSTFAQETEPSLSWMDSIYTVPPPEGYFHPIDTTETEVVEAAPFAPWTDELLDDFDTTAAVHLNEILREYDYVPQVPNSVVQDRLSCLEQEVPLNYHERVRKFIDYFAVKNRAYTLTLLKRKNVYFPMFERIFREEGVPEELKYLAIIESALRPTALSRVGARGLWQFMPSTGRMYKLKQNSHIDERMNAEKSTRAAAKYLRYLYEYFGDWELAIAGYNCGPGNIRKAQRRTEKFHFWDIYPKLPRETRSYLPQYVAMIYVMNYAEEHNLIQDQPDFEIEAEDIYVSQSVDLSKMATALNVCADDMKSLNSELRWGYLPKGVKNYALKIPSARVNYYNAHRDSILNKAKYTGSGGDISKGFYYHRVRSGESLGLIAKRNRVRVSELKSWNYLRGNTIYPGQKLKIYGRGYVPRSSSSSKSSSSKKKTTVTSSKYHTVRRGESVGIIAQKYGIKQSQLKSWNKLSGNTIYAGQKLAVAPPTSKSSSKKSSSTAKPSKSNGANSYYTVKKGDSLWEIAKKKGVSVESIKKWNNLRSNKLNIGQKLLIKS